MPLPTLSKEQTLPAEKVAELAVQNDGCMHVLRAVDGQLLIQVYPLSKGEAPIARAFDEVAFEFVFRPPTGREIVTYKKRSKSAQAETADVELFKGCILHPTPEVYGPVLERYALLFSTPKLLRALMILGGGEADEGKG